MNSDRILKLADYLTTCVSEEEFNMSHWHCGTSACIGGHCELMLMGPTPADKHYIALWDKDLPKAGAYLELTKKQRADLFFPRPNRNGLGSGGMATITLPMAIATLRSFAHTGDINWNALELTEE